MESTAKFDEKVRFIQDALDDERKDIFVNFFIKLAVNNVQEKDDKEHITKKALYLLKKFLLIAPNTNLKYTIVEKIINSYNRDIQVTFMKSLYNFKLGKIQISLHYFNHPLNTHRK